MILQEFCEHMSFEEPKPHLKKIHYLRQKDIDTCNIKTDFFINVKNDFTKWYRCVVIA